MAGRRVSDYSNVQYASIAGSRELEEVVNSEGGWHGQQTQHR